MIVKNHRARSIGSRAYVLPLRDISAHDSRTVGSKAANLGEMMRAGMRVPEGFALTVCAFDRFMEDNRIPADASPETVAKAHIPEDIAGALSAAAAELGDVALAVRSSAVAEDLAGASFAGQYETVLNVRSRDELFTGVIRCWSSAFSSRVASYRKTHERQGPPVMALLVQTMVPADVAGVAFSANPVNGDRSEAVVSAVRGLGERLVSGEASPDEWLVKDGSATRLSAPENAITAEQAKEIAAMARKAQAHFGTPQDTEWAIAKGRIFLLQARPITTLPAAEG
jgi:pyruvate,water dikinase